MSLRAVTNAALQKEGTMHARNIVLALLAAAVTLTSVASAGPTAAKQRVAINAKTLPGGTFVLTPLRAGALKSDSGTFNGNWQTAPGRKVIRNGQEVGTDTNTWTLTGKRGTLTIRERIEWVDTAATETATAIRTESQLAPGTSSGARARMPASLAAAEAAMRVSAACGTAASRGSSPCRSALHEPQRLRRRAAAARQRPVGWWARHEATDCQIARDRRGRCEGFRMNNGIAVMP
jgi:hypothetical protein